jgi:hypothetical protein
MAELQPLSLVALTEDLPAKTLLRGQVGTIVEKLAPGVFEVEFSDDAGLTYAMVPVPAALLMQLHHEPKHHAA